MTDKKIRPRMVLAAPHGSKRDWVTVSAEVPARVAGQVDDARGSQSRSAFLAEIITAHFDRAA